MPDIVPPTNPPIDPKIVASINAVKNATPGTADADVKEQTLITQIASAVSPFVPAKYQPLITPILAVLAVVVSMYMMKPAPVAPVQPPVVNVLPSPVLAPPATKAKVKLYLTSDTAIKAAKVDITLKDLGVIVDETAYEAGSKFNSTPMPCVVYVSASGEVSSVAYTTPEALASWLKKQ